MEVMKFDPNTYKLNDNTTLRALQLKILEIVIYFDHFCREHDLTYYLCGGSAIGAIRHKGFIPWDCDMDVCMPRKDYERLGKLWEQYADTDHYTYDRTTKTYNMHAHNSAIKDNYTTYIRAHNVNYDINQGVQIDVMPFDAMSDHWLRRQYQKFNGLLFSLFNAQRVPNQQSQIVKQLSRILLSCVKSPEQRYKIWKYAESEFSKYDINNCKYLGEPLSFHTINLRYPKEWFQKPTELEFEGVTLYGPTEPEKYLEVRYPGYTNYPPESEQIPKMKIAFVDLNTPYKNYKGIKYCINDNITVDGGQ